jgi:glucose-6-phosphate isomerase
LSDADAAWERLLTVAKSATDRRVVDLFDAEPHRLERLSLSAAGLELDLSKQPWSLADLDVALALAKAADVEAARERLFAGETMNASEGRAALHMALRAPKGSDFHAQGEPVSAEVDTTRAAMAAFAEAVRSGERRGATGKPFRSIVHIGIGGSDFGPRLVWEALRPVTPQIDLRFVANVDPADITLQLAGLDPAETLVIVVSKTFTTQETMTNAQAARAWLSAALGEGASAHLAAVSTALDLTRAFGVPDAQVFGFRDWVGGRYSVWSSVGLSCVIGLGPKAFEAFLAGAAALDDHFRSAPLAANAPVLLALAHVFNGDGLNRRSRAVVPYAQRLRLLPNFLQQLEMESNGKRVTADGRPVAHPTATVVFGDAGSNVQHAFFQLMHQGTDVVPLDIIAVAEAADGDPAAQQKLLANAIAQAEALMVGRPPAETPDAQRAFPGDRPSSFILMPRLEAATLGALIALYEHKTFVEGILWCINSFDQWGVELGKTLAARVLAELEGGPAGAHDPSTKALIAKLKR